MIKKKLIALASTLSLVSVVGVATANAANLELKYNEELSSATSRVVDINYDINASLYTLGGNLTVNCDGATTTFEELMAGDGDAWMANGIYGTLAWSDLNMSFNRPSSGTVGRFNITVPEGTPEFTILFDNIALECYDDMYSVDDITLTIPAWSTEPDVTYHKDVKATEVASSTDLLDAAAKGYEATVNYANGTVGKLVWSVTAGEQNGTIDATVAEVSGEPTVIYGLIIVDANVDKITDVVLTNVVE